MKISIVTVFFSALFLTAWFIQAEGPDTEKNEAPAPLKTIKVTTEDVSKSEVLSALFKNLKPGDCLEFRDGTYDLLKQIKIEKIEGTEEHPVIIKASHKGRAVITGKKAGFLIKKSKNIVIEGFSFRNGDGCPCIETAEAVNLRITRNYMDIDESGKDVDYVLLQGKASHHIRIDHNKFENKTTLGNFITIGGTTQNNQVVQYVTIDHNYFFGHRNRHNSNGGEAIRGGDSKKSMSSGFMKAEYNLFEECNGDPEVFSVKSCDNIIQYNTFRNNHGSLCLRHGNRNLVQGNFFIREPGYNLENETGGLRFYGDDHKIINNYFQGLTGHSDEAPLVLAMGDTDDKPLNARFRPHRVFIAFNTWAYCPAPEVILIGYDDGGKLTLPSIDCKFVNNIIIGNSGTLIKLKHEQQNLTLAGNIVYASGSASAGISNRPETEFKLIDPRLVSPAGIWKLSNPSPAIDSAVIGYEREMNILNDMDGQKRSAPLDIGADEYSTGGILIRPLTPADVGPDAP